MPDKKPTNILESIFYGVKITNENVVALSENLKDVADKVAAMQAQVNAMMVFLSQPAPDQPNARGEEGAEVVSSEQQTTE